MCAIVIQYFLQQPLELVLSKKKLVSLNESMLFLPNARVPIVINTCTYSTLQADIIKPVDYKKLTSLGMRSRFVFILDTPHKIFQLLKSLITSILFHLGQSLLLMTLLLTQRLSKNTESLCYDRTGSTEF